MKKSFISLMIGALLASTVAAPAMAAPRWGSGPSHRAEQRHTIVTTHKVVNTRNIARPNQHRWQRGQYMGKAERSRYVVGNWRGQGLRAPPRGYHWVRENSNSGNYLLVGIATGLIASIIAH